MPHDAGFNKSPKSSLATLYILLSIHHAQMANLFLRLTYNTNGGAVDQSYLQALEILTRSLDPSVPNPKECTPEAIRASLI